MGANKLPAAHHQEQILTSLSLFFTSLSSAFVVCPFSSKVCPLYSQVCPFSSQVYAFLYRGVPFFTTFFSLQVCSFSSQVCPYSLQFVTVSPFSSKSNALHQSSHFCFSRPYPSMHRVYWSIKKSEQKIIL